MRRINVMNKKQVGDSISMVLLLAPLMPSSNGLSLVSCDNQSIFKNRSSSLLKSLSLFFLYNPILPTLCPFQNLFI